MSSQEQKETQKQQGVVWTLQKVMDALNVGTSIEEIAVATQKKVSLIQEKLSNAGIEQDSNGIWYSSDPNSDLNRDITRKIVKSKSLVDAEANNISHEPSAAKPEDLYREVRSCLKEFANQERKKKSAIVFEETWQQLDMLKQEYGIQINDLVVLALQDFIKKYSNLIKSKS